MARLFHSKVRLSMSLLGAAALAGVLGDAGLGAAGATAAAPSSDSASPYFGRWQVEDSAARFSTRGRLYRTIDIAPCGRDFCGVSVDDHGACGTTLFRFLSRRRDGGTRLRGHGAWGTAKKKLTVDYYDTGSNDGRAIELNVGNSYDFGERGGSMPMFNATYTPRGTAQCQAR